MGRNKTPKAILERTGSRWAKGRADEPEPPEGLPKPPPMSKAARVKWDYYMPVLDEMGVITVAEGDLLANMCRAFAANDMCWEFIDNAVDVGDPKLLMELGGSGKKEHPILGTQRKFWEQGYHIACKFGLNPVDRGSVHPIERSPEDMADRAIKEALDRGK